MADQAAADKAAADKAAADKAATDKAALEQQQLAQPPLPPTPPGTTLVESGVFADKNGPTKLFYVKDANGNTIGGYYIHYDKQGREIGREFFKETSGSPTEQQPAATLSGQYAGSIRGKSAGTIVVNVSGGSVSGSLRGVHEGELVFGELFRRAQRRRIIRRGGERRFCRATGAITSRPIR